jgi:hypothetical protein
MSHVQAATGADGSLAFRDALPLTAETKRIVRAPREEKYTREEQYSNRGAVSLAQ